MTIMHGNDIVWGHLTKMHCVHRLFFFAFEFETLTQQSTEQLTALTSPLSSQCFDTVQCSYILNSSGTHGIHVNTVHF